MSISLMSVYIFILNLPLWTYVKLDFKSIGNRKGIKRIHVVI